MNRFLNFDARLSQRLNLSPHSGWWQLARLVAHLGDGPVVFGGLGLVYLLAWLGGLARLRQEVLITALVIVAAMLIVTLVKLIVRRQRPQPPGEFVTFQYDAYSFPSGHAARLAALTVSAIFFNPVLGWIFIGLTLAVALARVIVGVHYLADMIIGLALGGLVAWLSLALLSLYLLLPA